MEEFKNNPIGLSIYRHKYALTQSQTWKEKARTIVEDVCGRGTYGQHAHVLMSREDRQQLQKYIEEMKFLPGGRYVYYAGRQARFYNNCYLLRAEEDTREEWAAVTQRSMSCLMTGGGIGTDYSRLREAGRTLSRTGGVSSGPIPLMFSTNEIGRNVMQGGSRRSAIYASLAWSHPDAHTFLSVKDWSAQQIGAALKSTGASYTYADWKHDDFNAPAPLDMTNISLNYDDAALRKHFDPITHKEDIELREFDASNPIFVENVRYAMKNGEPGFSFNFGDKSDETLRNACTEVTSSDDSDVCNLGSVNMAACRDLGEFADVIRLGSKFLVCGTIRAELPYDKVYRVREKNRRLGLGLMGVHAWLLQRGHRYEMNPELQSWMEVYAKESEAAANEHCDRLFLSRPVAYRAIAPTGTISLIAGTTSGIEPLYAVAYKRRYLTQGTRWMYEYKIDTVAQMMIEEYGIDPSKIETAIDLAADPERRIAFQADVQAYVDMGISSTLNLPAWGSDLNNESRVAEFAGIVSKYAPRLRGLTFYPDGSRGGQPLTSVPYSEAKGQEGVAYEENASCRDGICGL